MTEPLLIETNPWGVCTLTLNRPERHNAFDHNLVAALLSRLQQIQADKAIRVMVLTGKGASFSSGADLEWMRSMVEASQEVNRNDARQLAELMAVLNQFNKPTIARVNGPAYGGGVGLLACCDIVIASKAATFAFTEVRFGLAPAVIAPYVIAAIGVRQARRYFLSAQPISANEALRIGLIHKLVDDDQLDEAVAKQVVPLLKAAPQAIAECKHLTGRLVNVPEEVREATAELIARLRVGPEAKEGITAFFEKRRPHWSR